MNKLLIAIISLSFFFVGCGINEPENNEVEIRLKNASSFDIENLTVWISGKETTHNELSANATTKYETYDFSYRYFYVEFMVDTIHFIQEPIDFEGEAKLPSAEYTYSIISIDTTTGEFEGELVRDISIN